MKRYLRPFYLPLFQLYHRIIYAFPSPIKKLYILTADETVKKIASEKLSVSRYGDGEFNIILGRNCGFQNKDSKLADRMKEVLNKSIPGHMVGLPRTLVTVKDRNAYSANSWRGLYVDQRKFLKCIIPLEKEYLDSTFTRFYLTKRNKNHISQYVDNLRVIWGGINITIVEGEKSRLGVGNDLFDNAASIERILCPAKNAFDQYDKILATVKEFTPKDHLILIALGMTATVLAYDLAKIGYWAIDIGHVDVEYCWMKMGATSKVPVPYKAVNEANGYLPEEDTLPQSYYDQIIKRIDC
ncbi:MAG: GT-D fold domain-containing protein [Bacteroidales bacterium]|nr:GT-D fold domain-containing protein [Bacteroidales bacterium]